MQNIPLLKRSKIEVKNIDPLSTGEDRDGDICRDLDIQDLKMVDIKTLRRAPWETQSAIVTVPTNKVPRSDSQIRIKSGWTNVSGRVLLNIIRCFRCHNIGHVAAKCTDVEMSDHKKYESSNEARCTLCVKYNGVNVRHVIGSLACTLIKMNNRESRPGKRPAVVKFGERNRG